MEENSFIKRKRGRDLINDFEILNTENKIKTLKKLKNIKANIQNTKIFEQYRQLTEIFNKNKDHTEIDLSNSKELKELLGSKSINLIEKNDRGYMINIDKLKPHSSMIIYKSPKIIGTILDPKNCNIDICFSNQQLNNIFADSSKYDLSIYSIAEDELISSKDNNTFFEDNNEYLFILNNKIKFDIKKMDSTSVFSPYNFKSKTEDPLIINKRIFYYFDIPEKFQENYVYVKSIQRNKLIDFLSSFVQLALNGQYLFFSGPKGIGKTTSLLYFSGLNYYSLFYFNFQSVYKQSLYNTKNILKFELIKFFSSYYDVNNKFIKIILNIIDEFNPNSTYQFILDFTKNVSLFLNDKNIDKSFFIILDQYSEETDFYIESFLKEIENYRNIRVIFSCSLNNKFTRKYLMKTIEDYSHRYKIHYFPKLITEDEELNLFYENEEEKNNYNISNFKKFGGLPIFYYLLKENKTSKIDEFINYIMDDIMKEINNENYISIIIDLLALIKSNCLLSNLRLKELLKIIPLKYITIKKMNIWYKSQKDFMKTFDFYIKDINITNNKFIEKVEKDINYDIGFEKSNNINLNAINENENFENINIEDYKITNISKKTSNLLRFYFIDENKNLTKLINNYFHLEDFPINIISEINNKTNKKISNNVANDYIINNKEISNFINIVPKNNGITVYKLEFLFPYMEVIFMKIIYNYIYLNQKNYNKLLDLGSIGGLFELIVIYYILSNKRIYDYEIKDSITIKSIVPNHYSIKYFSFEKNMKEYNYDFKKLCFEDTNNEILNINNECIFIKQENFNSKYYDCGLLVPVNPDDKSSEIKNFYLIVFQISILKESKKRLNENEHEINFYYIKKHLESKYKLNIISGYFYYILRAENNKIIDKETLNYSKGICLGFDITNGFLKENIKLINEKNLITDKFVPHNEASLLKDGKNISLVLLIKEMIQKNTIKIIDDKLFLLLKKYIENINKKELLKEQFKLLGNEYIGDSLNKLTSFFIYINVKEKIKIYIDGESLYLNANNKDLIKNNYCIISYYKVKIKKH